MSSVVIRELTKKFTSSIFTSKYRAVSSVTIFQNFSNNQKNNNYILNKSTFTPKIPKQVVIQHHKNMSSSQTNFSANFLFRQVHKQGPGNDFYPGGVRINKKIF